MGGISYTAESGPELIILCNTHTKSLIGFGGSYIQTPQNLTISVLVERKLSGCGEENVLVVCE